jgi:tRNA modification GTPase
VEDKQLLKKIKQYPAIIVVNKMDLPGKVGIDEIKQLSGDKPIVPLSLKAEIGLTQLEEAIKTMFFSGNVEMQDQTYVSNIRHIQLLKEAKGSVTEVIMGIKQGVPLDMAEIDLKNAWQSLGEVIGEAVAEDLIDQIFSQFCLGK